MLGQPALPVLSLTWGLNICSMTFRIKWLFKNLFSLLKNNNEAGEIDLSLKYLPNKCEKELCLLLRTHAENHKVKPDIMVCASNSGAARKGPEITGAGWVSSQEPVW